jgi:phosphatidylglycerophosphatase A
MYALLIALGPLDNLWQYFLAFVLFRLFDMLKPWPIAWLDRRIKGGLGVMIDDMVAAFFAYAAYQCIVFVW